MLERLGGWWKKYDRWISELIAGAIEADLREAGYEVGRTDAGAVIWFEPTRDQAPVFHGR